MTEIPPDFIDRVISDYLGVVIGSAVTVAGGIIAAVATTIIPWIREARQEKRLRAERAKYLAVRVIHILEMFIFECWRVIQHRGIAGKDEFVFGDKYTGKDIYSIAPVEDLPAIPEFPDDVDWKSVNSDLVHKLFSLQNSIRVSTNAIKNGEALINIPLEDYSYLYEVRWYDYSKLGSMAAERISELEEEYRISGGSENKVDISKIKQAFSDITKEIKESRESRPGWKKKFEQELLEALQKYLASGKPFPQPNKGEEEE